MRHKVNNKTLGCGPSHRRMLHKQLVTQLIEHGRIVTTLARAKAIRPDVDKVVTYAKTATLHAKRSARRMILNKVAFKRLFAEVGTDFNELPKHQGGYSRIIRWKMRKGDNAQLVLMELLTYKPKVKEPESDDKASKQKTPDRKKAESEEAEVQIS